MNLDTLLILAYLLIGVIVSIITRIVTRKSILAGRHPIAFLTLFGWPALLLALVGVWLEKKGL